MSDLLSILPHVEPKSVNRLGEFGRLGERLAAEHLVKNGYRLVMSNFKVPVGRNRVGTQISGEIDIIALDGETLCFVEVKTRRSEDFTPVITNVDRRKQRQIIRAARVYRRLFGVFEMPHRYDVVTILLPKHTAPTTTLIKGFWSEAVFRKRSWGETSWQGFW